MQRSCGVKDHKQVLQQDWGRSSAWQSLKVGKASPTNIMGAPLVYTMLSAAPTCEQFQIIKLSGR